MYIKPNINRTLRDVIEFMKDTIEFPLKYCSWELPGLLFF